jgi:hypothetical protein
MIKKTVTYKELFGDDEVTEDIYFNLKKSEAIKLQVSRPEGYDVYLKRIVAAGDKKAIIAVIDELIRAAYGIKTSDGNFIKSEELTNAFVCGNAYETVFDMLTTDDKVAAEFIRGMFPVGMI